MRQFLRGCGTLLIFLSYGFCAHAQDSGPDSAKIERPRKPTFIAETDQRFSKFYDLKGSKALTNIWGARVGLLYPNNVKAGLGFYYSPQTTHAQQLLPTSYSTLRRQLYVVTTYVEPYWWRREHWEFSTPVEVGLGRSVYRVLNIAEQITGTQRGWFVPAGLGASFSVKFPPLKWLRPTRWFGVNLLLGYRVALKKDFPGTDINYDGLYFSVGPIFFFDRFTADFKAWQRRIRARREARRTKEKWGRRLAIR